MVSTRFTTFVLLLLVLFLHVPAMGERNCDGVPSSTEMNDSKHLKGKETTKWRKMLVEAGNFKGTSTGDMVASKNISGATKRNHRRKLRHRRSQHHVRVQFGGFVDFSADYHVPKSHPPRNN